MTHDLRETTIRVASVPSSHVYVRHLTADGAADVARLPDPVPSGARSAESTWWPPPMLDPHWVEQHHRDFDVHHVHFGFDDRSPAQLSELVAALRSHGRPLVVTVHDLRNPHHADRTDHDAQLDVLVPAADAIVTLTAGAAREIQQRWGRSVEVIAHPHVVPLDEMRRRQVRREPASPAEFRVGVHAKSLRACMDPATVIPALVKVLREVPGGVLQVDVHTDVAEVTGARHSRELMEVVRRFGDEIDLRVHDYFTDAELHEYLASLDASVLPYRFGTHSGWLEACRDLGTTVIAPTCGHYADQGPVKAYVLDEDEFQPDSLVRAVWAAWADPVPPISAHARAEQRREVARAHCRLYERVLGR